MEQPDLLIFMSDQHSPDASSYCGGSAQTPNLEAMAKAGVSFDGAYTSCPLCVPARISMLLGKLPSKTGVFSNAGAIPECSATFLHSLVAAGYDTTLIGRMHFIGTNQRHGFTARLVGDMTPVTWNRPVEALARERGVFRSSYAEPGSLEVIGGGDSPVLRYDKDVIQATLEFLSKKHEKPQCILIGTYGPHFPYVAPPELYKKYRAAAALPPSFAHPPEYLNPVLQRRVLEATEETALAAQAAYFGMIETMDAQVGTIRAAFKEYTSKSLRPGVMVYLSDHGDQNGDRRMYGKETFFESSARIPLIFEGAGIPQGVRIGDPASIMDLGPTLCALAGAAPPPDQDGISLAGSFESTARAAAAGTAAAGGHYGQRAVLSELIDSKGGGMTCARMVRKDKYKLISYQGYEAQDLLFDLEADPRETMNRAQAEPLVLDSLRALLNRGWKPDAVLKNHWDYLAQIELVKAWEREVGPDDSERWKATPPEARVVPPIR